MMRIVEEKNIKNIKTDWENLISTKSGKIYLTYPFHLATFKSFQMYRIVRMKNDLRLRYICVEDEKIQSILPVIINKKAKRIGFIGEWAGAGYNDFIGGTKSEQGKIIEYLKENYSGYSLDLRDISWQSKINEMYETQIQKQCYYIPLRDGYEEWKATLSKKTRDNIGRVFRRIENENFDASFHIVDKMKTKDIRRICKLYYMHLNKIYANPNASWMEKLKRYISQFYVFTPIFAGINSIERCKVAYTIHNGEIISFHLFYEEEDGIILPKCAYDAQYFRYEVGSYNFLSLIRNCAENHLNVDMSRSFHEYKVWYGGQPYPNYCVVL